MAGRPVTETRGRDRRLRALALAASLLAAAVAATLVHGAAARARWRSDARTRAAAARTLGLGDLALSSTSRWLRNPTLSEPGAPFADGPAMLDADPAGGLLGPATPARATDPAAALPVRRSGPGGDR